MEFEQYKAHYKAKYKKTPKSYMFELDIEWLREFMLIPDSYRYNDIKRNIIKKAEKQLEAKTDIKFTWKEEKLGRKVTKLHISIEKNDKGSSDWLATRKAFIAYMRERYVNADIYTSRDKVTNKDLALSIAPDGKLYNKKGGELDPDRSYGMWDTLFEMAREDRLPCLQNSMKL